MGAGGFAGQLGELQVEGKTGVEEVAEEAGGGGGGVEDGALVVDEGAELVFGVGLIADGVDQAFVHGFGGEVDAAVGKLADFFFGQAAVFGGEGHETGLEGVDDVLEEGVLLGGHFAEGAEDVFILAGFDGDGGDAEHFDEFLEVEALHDHADGAGEGGGVGHDEVGGERDVVTAGCGHVAEEGEDAAVGGGFFEALEGVVEDVAVGDAAAGAVDGEEDSLHGSVGDGFFNRGEGGWGAVGRGIPEVFTGKGDGAFHGDAGDMVFGFVAGDPAFEIARAAAHEEDDSRAAADEAEEEKHGGNEAAGKAGLKPGAFGCGALKR